MKKRIFSALLALTFALPSLALFSGCSSGKTITLRVYNWAEYIDEGGEDSYLYDETENPDPDGVVTDFENWYEETYGASVRVEYSTFGTNEDLYNQLKLGDKYDLICPSEYMIMKLAAEGMLEPYSESFFDETDPLNYYVNNVSPFIKNVFDSGKITIEEKEHRWSEYAAGYMWGTTGIVYNPERVDTEDLKQGWSILCDPKYKGKVTTKDNVRDSYFVGLAIVYKDELLALDRTDPDYNKKLTEIMNYTEQDMYGENVVEKVKNVLLQMKKNIFGFETDTGKNDMMTGKISMNFAWGGDAVYAMDEAEEKSGVSLCYYIPEESSNLFFDGWAIPKDEKRPPEVKHAAEAFANFLARPDVAVRNMDYIGYSSVISGSEEYDDIRAYIEENYAAEEDGVLYDVSYFFGEETVVLIDEEQLNRQFYALFPTEEVMQRCAVMDYYGDAEKAINEMWTKIKGESLDAWAIIVIAVTAAAIVAYVAIKKVGHKIELPRKPKKGYTLVKQEEIR
ncbi:MAG: extracellular solute-binding protein [Clostridia bacterium]|nr:extracellular solute-binding protein [Clostridia bacterium]